MAKGKTKEFIVDDQGFIRFVSYKAYAKKHDCKELDRSTGHRWQSHSEIGLVSIFTEFRPQGTQFPLKDAVDPVTGNRIS